MAVAPHAGPQLAIAGALTLTVLLHSLTRAWMTLTVALAIFGYLTMLTSRRAITWLKLMALLASGVLFATGLTAAPALAPITLGSAFGALTLEMEYDTGTEGRFGGQQKVIGPTAEPPLGLGALELASATTLKRCTTSI